MLRNHLSRQCPSSKKQWMKKALRNGQLQIRQSEGHQGFGKETATNQQRGREAETKARQHRHKSKPGRKRTATRIATTLAGGKRGRASNQPAGRRLGRITQTHGHWKAPAKEADQIQRGAEAQRHRKIAYRRSNQEKWTEQGRNNTATRANRAPKEPKGGNKSHMRAEHKARAPEAQGENVRQAQGTGREEKRRKAHTRRKCNKSVKEAINKPKLRQIVQYH